MHHAFSRTAALALFLTAVVFVIMAPRLAGATLYQPGATLNPDCAPGTSNCGVVTTASTTTFVASGTGAVSRTVSDKLAEGASVKDFGAKGDGVTDDTAAFTAALAAHNYVVVPHGTYRITGPITLYTSQGLVGDGTGRSIVNYAGNGVAIRSDPNAAASSVLIADLTLTDVGTGTVGLNLSTMSNSLVKRIVVNNFTTNILLGGNATTGNFYDTFEEVSTTGGTDGVVIGGSTGVDISSAHVFIGGRHIANQTGIRIKNGYGNRFSSSIDGTGSEVGIRFMAGNNNKFEGYLERLGIGYITSADNASFPGSSAPNNIVIPYYDGVTTQGSDGNGSTWNLDSFFYNSNFVIGANGYLGIGMSPSDPPTSPLHIKSRVGGYSANIKIDNTAHTNGRMYQFGSGILDESTFSVYDLLSSNYIDFDGATGALGLNTKATDGMVHLKARASGPRATLAMNSAAQTGGRNYGVGEVVTAGHWSVFDTASGQYFDFDGATGRLGVGVTPGSYKLDVNGTLRATALFDYDNANYFVDPSSVTNAIIVNGSVGIGTTNPGTKLSVSGSARLIGTATSSVTLGFGTDDGAAGWSIGNGVIDNTHNFRIYDNAVGAARVTVDGSGNVGIGTTSPASKLHLYSTSGANAKLVIEAGGPRLDFIETDATADNHKWVFEPTSGQFRGRIFNDAESSASDWLQVNRSGTTVSSVILPNGNLGIGTSTPTLGPLTMGSGAYVTTGGVWTNASDRNLKENFATVAPADILQEIDALSITQWNYKAEGASIRHIGPTAQDFYAAFGLGGEAGKTSVSTIDPAGVALLGIKALDQKIASLQGSLTGNVTAASLGVYVPSNFSGDSVGEARILAGQTSVRIAFRQAYAHQPIVTFAPEGYAAAAFIREKGASGFTLMLASATTTDTTFDWQSFASPEARLTVSDGTTQDIALVVVTLPPGNSGPAVTVASFSSTPANDSSAIPTTIPASGTVTQPADPASTSTPASSSSATGTTTPPTSASSSASRVADTTVSSPATDSSTPPADSNGAPALTPPGPADDLDASSSVTP